MAITLNKKFSSQYVPVQCPFYQHCTIIVNTNNCITIIHDLDFICINSDNTIRNHTLQEINLAKKRDE